MQTVRALAAFVVVGALAANAAAQTQPSGPVGRVTFRSDPDGLVIYRHVELDLRRANGAFVHPNRRFVPITGRIAYGEYEELCTAPCALALPFGRYELALSKPNGLPLDTDPIRVAGPESTYLATARSFEGVRIAGGVVAFGSAIAGLVLALTAHGDEHRVIVAAAVGGGGLVLGIGVAALVGDSLTVEPAAPVTAPTRPSARTAPCLALSGAF